MCQERLCRSYIRVWPGSLPDAGPVDVVGIVGGNGRKPAYRLGGKFDLQGHVTHIVGHRPAGYELAHPPFIQLEGFETALGFGLNVFAPRGA